jgi:hypothetical protein
VTEGDSRVHVFLPRDVQHLPDPAALSHGGEGASDQAAAVPKGIVVERDILRIEESVPPPKGAYGRRQ